MPPSRQPLTPLRLAEPCKASWQEMEGNDKVRFCRECQLSIHNLSAMSRAEAAALLQEKSPRVCVGFSRRPDGTILYQERMAALARFTKVALAVGLLTLLVFLATFLTANTALMTEIRQIGPLKTFFDWMDSTGSPTPTTVGAVYPH